MKQPLAHQDYRPEIDGLRALAVLPVIFFHGGVPGFAGGFVGVDVFFVISGYLITRILLAEMAGGTFSLAGFYERRARRILPALFLVTAACLPWAWLWMPPEALKAFGRSLAAVAFFGSNLLFWQESGYFDTAAEQKPLLHTWSLGVEEQFYLLFPLLLPGLFRLRPVWRLAALSILALLSLGLAEHNTVTPAPGAFFLPHLRAWELLAGALLALIQAGQPAGRPPSTRRHWGAASGLAMIVLAVATYSPRTPYPGLATALPVAGAVLLLACADGGNPVGRLLASPPLVRVGLASYSAYLWHQPLLAFARLRLGTPPQGWTLLALLAATALLSALSWRWVEQPFRHRRRIGRQQLWRLAAAGSAGLVLIGGLSHWRQGFPERLEAETRALLATAAPSPLRARCHTAGPDYRPVRQACQYFSSPATWAVLGDSHLVEPAYALAQMLQTHGQGLLHLTFSGCAPAAGSSSLVPGCSPWLREALARVEEDDAIHNVLLGFRYSAHLFGHHSPAYPALPDEAPRLAAPDPATARAAFWRGFAQLIARLHAANKRVFVLGPVPEIPYPAPQTILAHQFQGPAGAATGTSRRYFETRHAQALQQLAHLPWGPKLIRVEPADLLCDQARCAGTIERTAWYYDDNHLSPAGAQAILAPLTPYLAEEPLAPAPAPGR